MILRDAYDSQLKWRGKMAAIPISACLFFFVIPRRNPESRATTSGFPDAQLRI
jgi:hypothetical protein